MAGMDLKCDLSVVRHNNRWSASSVHRQGGTDESLCAGRQQRASGRHRIRTRSEGSGNHDPISRQTYVQVLIYEDVNAELGAPSPGEDEIVNRPSTVPVGGAHHKRRQLLRNQLPAAKRSSPARNSLCGTLVRAPTLPYATPITGVAVLAATCSALRMVPSPPSAVMRSHADTSPQGATKAARRSESGPARGHGHPPIAGGPPAHPEPAG